MCPRRPALRDSGEPENTSSRDGLSAICQSERASACRTVFSLASSPSASACGELVADVRRVVQCAGIEIRPVRPHQRSGLGVQDHAIEHRKILKRTEQRAVKHGPKVDVLSSAVTEAQGNLVRPSHFEAGHADN
jgi:hypothetical protein